MASAALVGLDEIFPHLGKDHIHAQQFATGIAQSPRITVDHWRVQSNIVMFTVDEFTDVEFVEYMLNQGVRLATIKPGMMRAVFHHQVPAQQVETAIEAVLRSVEHKL